MVIEKPIALLEEVLAPWRERIGADFDGYKNHVSRMLNFCFALRACGDEERRKLIIAGAFHDIGIWSDGTVDYLPPSIAQAKLYLTQHGLTDWILEIELIIDLHHKLRRYRGDASPLVEIFRKADLADFSLGVVTGGVPAATDAFLETRIREALALRGKRDRDVWNEERTRSIKEKTTFPLAEWSPNAGFHKRLAQLAGGWFAGHPFSPPPFMKW